MKRREILGSLVTLPTVAAAEHDEVLRLVEAKYLYGVGIGWIDAHLLASAQLSQALLWTSDTRLRRLAESLWIAYTSIC